MKPENINGLTKEEWIDRCTARYMARAGLDEKTARDAAETCFEENWLLSGLINVHETPEDAADEDMSCWSDDEHATNP